jgi:hypothetical protein
MKKHLCRGSPHVHELRRMTSLIAPLCSNSRVANLQRPCSSPDARKDSCVAFPLAHYDTLGDRLDLPRIIAALGACFSLSRDLIPIPLERVLAAMSSRVLRRARRGILAALDKTWFSLARKNACSDVLVSHVL